jgi:DNA replicative helicase MCM subunit Mcm2 (Cdc46/Mcm family)
VGNSIGGTHVRPDIHVLVVGDPGLGKSQLLRAAAAVAPRAVFVCGNTTTTAGLLELHFTHIRIIPYTGCFMSFHCMHLFLGEFVFVTFNQFLIKVTIKIFPFLTRSYCSCV